MSHRLQSSTVDSEAGSFERPTVQARSTVSGTPLSADELRKTDAYWRACNYLSLGMIYLLDNPLLTEPLQPEHIKNRLLGHWGSSPGLVLHLRALEPADQEIRSRHDFYRRPRTWRARRAWPGYLEGTYSEIYPDKSEDDEGCANSSSSSLFPAASAATARPKRPARSTKAANSAMCSRTPAARLSIIPI